MNIPYDEIRDWFATFTGSLPPESHFAVNNRGEAQYIKEKLTVHYHGVSGKCKWVPPPFFANLNSIRIHRADFSELDLSWVIADTLYLIAPTNLTEISNENVQKAKARYINVAIYDPIPFGELLGLDVWNLFIGIGIAQNEFRRATICKNGWRWNIEIVNSQRIDSINFSSVFELQDYLLGTEFENLI